MKDTLILAEVAVLIVLSCWLAFPRRAAIGRRLIAFGKFAKAIMKKAIRHKKTICRFALPLVFLLCVHLLWGLFAHRLYGMMENNGWAWANEIYRTGTYFGVLYTIALLTVIMSIFNLRFSRRSRKTKEIVNDRTSN